MLCSSSRVEVFFLVMITKNKDVIKAMFLGYVLYVTLAGCYVHHLLLVGTRRPVLRRSIVLFSLINNSPLIVLSSSSSKIADLSSGWTCTASKCFVDNTTCRFPSCVRSMAPLCVPAVGVQPAVGGPLGRMWVKGLIPLGRGVSKTVLRDPHGVFKGVPLRPLLRGPNGPPTAEVWSRVQQVLRGQHNGFPS